MPIATWNMAATRFTLVIPSVTGCSTSHEMEAEAVAEAEVEAEAKGCAKRVLVLPAGEG